MKYVTENLSLAWLCVAALAVLAELLFRRYVPVWFSVGAGCATAASLLHCPWWGQGILFLAVSVSLWLIFRKWSRMVRCSDSLEQLHFREENGLHEGEER